MKYITFIKSYSQQSIAWRRSWRFIGLIAFIALLGPFIANEKPYYCKLADSTYFPIFQNINEAQLSASHPEYAPVSWKDTKFTFVWYAPIPYSHYSVDLRAGTNVSPFDSQPGGLRFRHWLGTDPVGRDVMAGMIRGCRVSFLIGIGSMLIALLIGVPMGAVSAYYGNNSWRMSIVQLISMIAWILIALYVCYLPISFFTKVICVLLISVIGVVLHFLLRRIPVKKTGFPVDQFVMALISIIDSFPGLFLILILLFIVPVKGWLVVMLAIALLRWPVMARYMRAEVFKIKEGNYIRAVQALNLPDRYILKNHIIPYAFRPVMISFIFGVSSAILAESSLSFLGIGLPAEEVNWGRLLSQARNHFESWWLVLFPGLALFFTLLSLYTIGNRLRMQE